MEAKGVIAYESEVSACGRATKELTVLREKHLSFFLLTVFKDKT